MSRRSNGSRWLSRLLVRFGLEGSREHRFECARSTSSGGPGQWRRTREILDAWVRAEREKQGDDSKVVLAAGLFSGVELEVDRDVESRGGGLRIGAQAQDFRTDVDDSGAHHLELFGGGAAEIEDAAVVAEGASVVHAHYDG